MSDRCKRCGRLVGLHLYGECVGPERTSSFAAPAGSPSDVEIRKLLWLRHGCPLGALYGDDGEMQCGVCLVDFRRDSAADMIKKFSNTNWRAPVPQLEKTFPLVIYFPSRDDADEFMKLAKEAKPNFKAEELP